MDNKKGALFFFGVIAAIIGWKLFKKFDFEHLRLNEKPALALIYLIAFGFSVFGVIKNLKRK
ncbi:MAG: hypothetical protein R2822_14805 [Spirosomataceae bacterium]